MESKNIVKECAICHKTFINPKKSQFKGKVCNKCRERYRVIFIKQKAIKYLGGKCEICGYNKCLEALDFHHINPLNKNKKISNLYNRSWNVIKEELDKCQLLCANCHRELHSKEDL